MSLAQKFSEASPSSTGLPCGVSKLMSTMSKNDAEALNSVLFNDENLPQIRLSNSKIYQILREEGYDIPPSSIAQHRRRQCRCFVGRTNRTKDSK